MSRTSQEGLKLPVGRPKQNGGLLQKKDQPGMVVKKNCPERRPSQQRPYLSFSPIRRNMDRAHPRYASYVIERLFFFVLKIINRVFPKLYNVAKKGLLTE